MGSIGFHTIAHPPAPFTDDELGSVFAASDPFHSWHCAFCERVNHTCSCASVETTPGLTPRIKSAFQAFVQAEHREAVKLQEASKSYWRALVQHVPLGWEFNEDQRRTNSWIGSASGSRICFWPHTSSAAAPRQAALTPTKRNRASSRKSPRA